jgi:hypothetical protein
MRETMKKSIFPCCAGFAMITPDEESKSNFFLTSLVKALLFTTQLENAAIEAEKLRCRLHPSSRMILPR